MIFLYTFLVPPIFLQWLCAELIHVKFDKLKILYLTVIPRVSCVRALWAHEIHVLLLYQTADFFLGQQMAMDGSDGYQRALLENGDESPNDPIYKRSASLKTFTVSPPLVSRVTWVRKGKMRRGNLSYSYNDEQSCINVCKGYANFFDAMVLEKVNTEFNGDEKISGHAIILPCSS